MGFDYGGVLPLRKVEQIVNRFSIAYDYNGIYVGVADVSARQNSRLVSNALKSLGISLTCRYAQLEANGKKFFAYRIPLNGNLTVEQVIACLAVA